MNTQNLANLEALINIGANASEILLISCGIMLLFVFWVPKENGIPGYKKKLGFLSLGCIFTGLFVPGFLNFVVAGRNEIAFCLAALFGVVLAIGSIVLWLVVYFLPAYFATKVNPKKSKVGIIVLNVFSFIFPLIWIFAFIWACNPEKEQALGHRKKD